MVDPGGSRRDGAAVDAPEGDRNTRRRRATRERLLEAARDLVLQRGVGHYTVSELAEGADVGIGTVYNHFADWRDEPLREMCDRVVDGWSALCDQALADHPNAASAAAAVVSAVGSAPADSWNSMALTDVLMRTPQWPQERAIATAAAFIEAGIADGSFDPDLDATTAAAALVGFLLQMVGLVGSSSSVREADAIQVVLRILSVREIDLRDRG